MTPPLTPERIAIETARAHLIELADGWENGARLEDQIVRAFAPELEAFTAPEAREGKHDIRLIRSVLDARENRDHFLKDAAAVRLVIAAPAAPSPDLERLREALKAAYEQGCIDTHNSIQNEPELALMPVESAEFGEGADDYAVSACRALASEGGGTHG